MIRIVPRSLTVRLSLLFGIVSTIVLAVIGYALYATIQSHFLQEDAEELRGKSELVRHLVAQLRTEADLATLPDRMDDALTGHRKLFVAVRRLDGGDLLFMTTGAPLSLERVTVSGNSAYQDEGTRIDSVEANAHLFRTTWFDAPTSVPGLAGVRVRLAMNVDDHRDFMARVRNTLWILVLSGVTAAGLLGWLAVRIGLGPVRALAALTSRISAERLSDRVEVERLPPELARLGDSFNAMLARLEDSFRRLREFSSDLAHELRTPITALLMQSQVALSRSRSAEDYREVIYSAMEEYERLARMISDMLFLAKADHGLLVPARERLDLHAEIVALFDFYDALVEARGIKLEVRGSGAVQGDHIMIGRAVSNLLSNAIAHTSAGGTITVEIASHDHDSLSIAVTNPGPSIPAEYLPRLFDRFQRVDPARQRTSEGVGLGLAITKSIVAAHGGSIFVTSESGMTRFEIRLPAPR